LLIDWFTIIAQIINFLVLVALLKYFLYGRILQAMDRREEEIASRLAEAEEREREARHELEDYQAKLQDLEDQRPGLMIQTREEAEASRKQLMKDARDEVEGTRTRWLEALDREKNSFLQELRRRAGEQILDIVRRVLADLADTGLEQQVIEGFSKRLTEMDQEKRETVIASLKTDRNVVITSAFELPDSARNENASVQESNLEDGLQLTFRTSPEVVTGIEVKLPGYKMAWSVDDYLESLEANLREALEEKASL